MKKLFIVLLCLISFASKAQTTTYFTAVKTALYEKYSWESEYKYSRGNNDVSIPVSLTSTVISIQAEIATTLKIYPNTNKDFAGRTSGTNVAYKGTTWQAYDIVKDRSCTVDLVVYANSEYVILAVNYPGNPAVNIRYYLIEN